MIRVGIVGLGGMGNKHFGCHEAIPEVEVVALADVDESRLRPGETSMQINVVTGRAVIDPGKHSLYPCADDLIADPSVELVDICLPTYLHADCTIKALDAGKHVLCEKPMALTYAECRRVLDAASGAPGKLMIAQCVRFFPAYEYLKETVDSGRLGALVQLSMWRGGAPPDWAWDGWLEDHTRSGGQILDLHIHDADFVHHLLGMPRAVYTVGARGFSGGWDVIETDYLYDDGPVVHASANSALPPAFGFEARYQAAFEGGCLLCSTAGEGGVREMAAQEVRRPSLEERDGYQAEIEYFLACIRDGQSPEAALPESSALSVRLVEAERESVESGRVVEL